MFEKTRLDSLTRFRGIAALTVALYHSLPGWNYYSFLKDFLQFGWTAVPFFFCLSGFVLQLNFSSKDSPLFFLIKRFAKIYPVALLGLVISIIAYKLIGSPLAGYVGEKHSVLLSAILMQAWAFNSPHIRQSWDGVSWTLSCELFFYLLAPYFFPLMQKFSLKVASIVLCFISILYFMLKIFCVRDFGGDFFIYSPISWFPVFIAGTCLAIIFQKSVYQKKINVLILAVVGVIFPVLLCNYFFGKNAELLSLSIYPGVLLLIYFGANNDRLRSKLKPFYFEIRLNFLGNISYSLYMMHALILGAYVGLIHKMGLQTINSAILTFVYLLLVVGISYLVYYFVELPAHKKIIFYAKSIRENFLSGSKQRSNLELGRDINVI